VLPAVRKLSTMRRPKSCFLLPMTDTDIQRMRDTGLVTLRMITDVCVGVGTNLKRAAMASLVVGTANEDVELSLEWVDAPVRPRVP